MASELDPKPPFGGGPAVAEAAIGDPPGHNGNPDSPVATDGNEGNEGNGGGEGELSLDDIEELDESAVEAVEDAAGEPAEPPPTPPVRAPSLAEPAMDTAEREPTPPPALAPSELPAEPEVPAVPLEQQLEHPTAVDRTLAAASDWNGLLARLEKEIESSTDKTRIGLLSYELGELAERRLNDEARAVKAFHAALKSDASLRPNLWAIRRVFYRRGLWPNLLKLIDAELRFARTDRERADLLVEKAQVLEDRLDQRGEAREALERAVALDPTSLPALMGLERVAVRDGDEQERARALRGLADAAVTPGRKLGYLLDLIRLHAQPGADADGLAAARQVLVEALALAPEAGVVDRVSRERERLAELSGDPIELLAALEARIAHVRERFGPDGPPPAPATARQPGSPLDRDTELRLEIVALRRRQARIARDQAADASRAWNYLEQALALAGGEPLVLADLSDLAERMGRYAELAELCRGWESLEGDPVRSLALGIRRAEALMRGGQKQQAQELLDKLSAGAPGYLPITAVRERDALDSSDFAALAEVYRAGAEAALLGSQFGPDQSRPDPAGAAALWVLAGDLYASFAGRPEDARGLYEKALEAAPGYAPAVEALATLLERTGQFDDCAALIERSLADVQGAADPVRRRHLLERLVRVRGEQGDREAVLAGLRRLLGERSDDLRLRWRIEELLAELGRDGERLDLLVDLAGRLGNPGHRAGVLMDAARIAERLPDRIDQAIDLYRQLLAVRPDDAFARVALRTLLRRTGRWQELVDARRAEVAEGADGPALIEALRDAADLLRHRLGRPGEAAALLRELSDRVPGDRFAAAELADALEVSSDHGGAAAVFEQMAAEESDPAARTALLVRLGQAQERAGRAADALDAYRRALAGGAGSELVAVAMLDLAGRAGDASAQVEALAALAEPRTDATLKSSLLEEAAWLWAFELEDHARAADLFHAATDADPTRRGPTLGGTLVQARRGELAESGEALAALAGALHAPYAAASLLLRAGAIAEVAGDLSLAQERVARAAAIAPDDPATLVVAAEYLPAGATDEIVGLEARDQLLQRAALYGMRAALSSQPVARDDWELEQAEALEAAGQLREAGHLVAGVLASRPDDVRALTVLRRLYRRAGDRAGFARATLALGRVIGDRDGKLTLLREAARIFDDELEQVPHAVAVYRRILAEDPGAPEHERLATIYRQHKDARGLVERIGDRLAWIDQSDGPRGMAVPLLYERAQLRAGIGDPRGAINDLEALLAIDDTHGGALRDLAELQARAGNGKAAVRLYQRYLQGETEPGARAQVELALSQLLAENMGDLGGAIEQLERVIEQSPDDLGLRERLIGLVSRAGDWVRVVREIRDLERLRPGGAERARDELQIAAVFRDRLRDRANSTQALERARQLDPLNVDAVRELAELASNPLRKGEVLAHGASDVRAALTENPARTALYERLAVIAMWQGDDDARGFALAALGSLGTLSAEQKAFVARRRAATRAPRAALSAGDWHDRLAHPGSAGFAAELWQALAEAVAKGAGLEPGALGFGRAATRFGAKNAARSLPAVAAALRAFAVEECELQVAESRPGAGRALAGSPSLLLLGGDVARADDAAARFALGRAVAHAREHTGALVDVGDAELVAWFAAAARVASAAAGSVPAELAGARAADVDDKVRLLGKHLGRRERKNLSLLASRFGELGPVADWRQAALATGMRAGLLLAGDLEAALDVLDVGRGGRAVADDPAALELLAWAVSDDHLALRRQLEVVADA